METTADTASRTMKSTTKSFETLGLIPLEASMGDT
jgi:hypothetical protein